MWNVSRFYNDIICKRNQQQVRYVICVYNICIYVYIYVIYVYIFYIILAGMKSGQMSLHCFDSSAGLLITIHAVTWPNGSGIWGFLVSLAVGQSCRKELLHSKPVQQNNIHAFMRL